MHYIMLLAETEHVLLHVGLCGSDIVIADMLKQNINFCVLSCFS